MARKRKGRQVIAEEWFPRPVQLGPRVFRWVRSEVVAAIAARAPRRSEPGSEPQQLLRARVERLKRSEGAAA